MPKFRCGLRRRLWKESFEAARSALEYYRDNCQQRLAPALSGRELEDLLDHLAEILDRFVVYGVQRDLQQLNVCNVLKRNVKNVDKPLPDEVTLDALFYRDKNLGKYTGAGIEIDKKVTPEDQYKRYFEWFIKPEKLLQQSKIMTGVQAFYDRYPLLNHAVHTAAAYYQTNIVLACDRVNKDWADINKAFFPASRMTRLVKIKSTGNDFHKGGKQVLILTFEFSDASGRCSTGRVVYKPSGVEIDCRIVGNSTVFTSVAPKGEKDTGAYAPGQSLTEILNRYNRHECWPEEAGDLQKAKLPTYVILPYNRESVPHSYGYIEFLEHEPIIDARGRFNLINEVGKAIIRLPTETVDRSDWIISDEADSRAYCYEYGSLMAMAVAVSLCDLHQQNVIAHKHQPHLIDLEEALKWPMEKITETYLDRGVTEYWDPVGEELVITNDRRSDLDASWKSAAEIPSTAALYHYQGRADAATLVPILADTANVKKIITLQKMVTVTAAKFAAHRNCDALRRGLIDGLVTLADPTCNQEVQQWVKGLGQTIARFVPLGTATYLARFRELYQKYPDKSPKPSTSLDWRNFAREEPTDFFLRCIGNSRKDWIVKLDRAAKGLIVRGIVKWAPPAFAVDHPDHAWQDYLNGDVPSFYHKLGDRDLLNSRGEKVDVHTVIAWQNTNFSDLNPDVRDLPENCGRSSEDTSHMMQFFPETPIQMVCAQLEQLRENCATIEKMTPFVNTAVTGVFPIGNVFTKSLGSILSGSK